MARGRACSALPPSLLRAELVARPEKWKWPSLPVWPRGERWFLPGQPPVRGRSWLERGNEPLSAGELAKPRTSASARTAAPNSAPAKSASSETATIAPALGGGDLVWVNTEKHVYHSEGSRFYGTTKNGKYMTEQEAIQTGNKAARLGRAGRARRYNRLRKVPQSFTSRRDSRL